MRYLFSLSIVLFTLSAAAQNVNHWESLINAGNEWHYFPGVSEPPANWAALTFNDASWQKGPGGIGWGDGDDATIISRVPSVYLRRKFTVSDPEHIVSLIFFIDFDDAFVAYLNGHEIARANIGAPGVKPLFNHYAANCDYEAQLPSGGVPAMFILNSQQKGLLNQGENVLAIQVHDCNATSSDLSSTAFLIAGISVPGNFYQAVPGWFTNRLNQTSHLPLIMIDTGGRQIPDEPKITARMRIIDNGPGNQNSVFDPAREFDGPVGIEVRGQSSQSFPKKSYGFETRTESGGENKVSLLGMPAHDDWVLYAPYSDKTMMRNDLSYYLGRRMGRWQPDAHYVEVYLNGQYIGVYQLIERIKRGNNRVNIAKMESSDVTGDKVTGGYIFKVDKIHDLSSSEYFYSNPAYRYKNARNYAYSYYYPKSDAIVWSQRSYLQNFLYQFENNLNASWFANPASGYMRYIDAESFIDFQIINELANNVDGYRYSTFFYKQRDSEGGKLVAGPLWDFDLGYGNLDYSQRHMSTSQWCYTNYGPGEPNCIHWWARMMEDPVYEGQLKTRYSNLRKTVLHTDSIMAYLDSRVAGLGDAIGRNFQRWQILGVRVWPNYYIGPTHHAEVNFLKNWITNRLNWMDSQWLITTGTDDAPRLAEVFIYPNPALERIYVEPGNVSPGSYHVSIYDIQGKQVMISRMDYTGGRAEGLDVAHLPSGLYLIRLRDDRLNLYSGKFLKK
ncbi:MAG: CotH kinase family protein [Bacteroidota bacterium]